MFSKNVCEMFSKNVYKMFPSYLGLELSGLALLDGGVQAHGHHLDRARQVFPANLGRKRVSGLLALGLADYRAKCVLCVYFLSLNWAGLRLAYY